MGSEAPSSGRRIDLASVPAFQLGALTIDPSAHEVRSERSRHHLQPQPLKVLVALARQRSNVVSRDELVDACWDGRVVGDDVVNRAILVLRTLARRTGGYAIETVPKAGYRLIEAEDPPSGRRRRGLVAGLAVAAAGLILLLLLFQRSDKQSEPPTPSVVVLPFTASGDRQMQGLATAINDAVVHMLNDSSLPVQRARSADEKRASADLMVTGNLRRADGSVSLTLQLQDVQQDEVLFSKVFTAPIGQAGTLPEQVGAYAAANLTWTGAMMMLDRRHSPDPRVTVELLKQSMITIEQGDLFRAYQISAHIAPRAPDSAIAQLSLALNTAFILDQLPRQERPAALAVARKAAERARMLAPQFSDVYLPPCVLQPPIPISICENALRQGLLANSQAVFSSAWMRRLLSEVGRNREAINYARMSLAHDPYKPGKLAGLIGRLEVAGDTAEADRLFRQGVRWWPGLRIFYWERANGMAQRGDLDAVARFAVESPPDLMPIDRSMAAALADGVRSKRPDRVRERCRVVRKRPGESIFLAAGTAPGSLSFCLVALSQLADRDAAFALAFASYPDLRARTAAEREARWLDHPVKVPPTILAAPALPAMRRDPRFLALADRVGLLDYWRSGYLPDFCRDRPEPLCRVLKVAG